MSVRSPSAVIPGSLVPIARRAAAWTVVGFLAAGLRLSRLNFSSYWLDEILQVYMIRDSWDGLWRSLHWNRLHAPLDYVVLKVLEGLHPSDAARRIPAALWGVGCVLAFGFLIGRRAGSRTGFVAGLLLALAPYHVHYSQEVRPYSLGMFFLCVSLLLLDRYLEKPGFMRVAGLCLACVATAYSLYLAALVLCLAGAAMVVEDCLDEDKARRDAARRFLKASPLFLVVATLLYAPWWSVLLQSVRSPPMSQPPVLELRRIWRLFSYFGFGPTDWHPLGAAGVFFVVLTLAGVLMALAGRRLRFIIAWGIGGLIFIEALEHRHPTFDSVFHFLPAGMALTALFSLPIGWLFDRGKLRLLGVAALAASLFFDGRSLAFYFRQGRPDWRPLARFLRQTSPSERIFVSNQYSQLCLGFYIVGPDWLCCKRPEQREIVNLDGKALPISWAWSPDRNAWLVLSGGPASEELERWSAPYPSIRFPTAEGEGGAVVRHLVRPQGGVR